MHETHVVMKNGETFEAPMWSFKPEEGWFTLVGPEVDRKLFFRDVESMVTKGERNSVSDIGDCDELERARKLGWDGS